ncbi:MAG: HypC/HybG/HupF family hydrogenase formation chaperone [Mobiluncus porci]|uniref:HypC/HybG/HupF family hydrogenase formation chaperone n=1 Tax=Mobiluncus porci TaxID=2652278 RepID=A0A7K0K5H9_9ACTO|nr:MULTISPECIES: HypC/HybG/HupF family hydrogenase formation chaperone [Mobiluncus]MCI6584193.1 HypC/HybG/HupF family hydrogenase formation chaperone [Mobiluncus sp.]MDD7541893.1 HypC/HybG/HupF family hydrogenase formation chaperone [Mobiluncus porci]MDY5749363.1 HypC/HybG/HupF family hydrogenase formation chaperone [Mobiluncus porci]MST50295.1 HypC/HybG/HupF family hydrogenase formation chaperone [Mobiluncus porci]
MCVGVPCRILSITPGLMPMGRIDVAGQVQDACMAYVPEAKVGDYVLIQNGFAMDLLTPEEARESLETWVDLGMVDEKVLVN